MRTLFTNRDAASRGISRDALLWGERTAKWRRIIRGVYGEGPEDPSRIDIALAHVVLRGGVADGALAGVLHGLDSVVLDGRKQRRRNIECLGLTTVQGIRCTGGCQTLLDLAAILCDDVWEQALESALRKRLTSVPAVVAALPELGRSRTSGCARIKRVLALRPEGAPPTESLLETLMVQLARKIPGLPPPVRQYRVVNEYGRLVARVDLCWPDLGLFIELDGEHHLGQPVYDASRETAVVAATGWLCGRFTWHEVTRNPRSTARRLAALVERARARPMAS